MYRSPKYFSKPNRIEFLSSLGPLTQILGTSIFWLCPNSSELLGTSWNLFTFSYVCKIQSPSPPHEKYGLAMRFVSSRIYWFRLPQQLQIFLNCFSPSRSVEPLNALICNPHRVFFEAPCFEFMQSWMNILTIFQIKSNSHVPVPYIVLADRLSAHFYPLTVFVANCPFSMYFPLLPFFYLHFRGTQGDSSQPSAFFGWSAPNQNVPPKPNDTSSPPL